METVAQHSYNSSFPCKEAKLNDDVTAFLFRELDSTNWEAERFARSLTADQMSLVKNGVVFVSDTQTNGQGSHYRSWVSKPGGLYYTLLLEAPVQLDDASPGVYAKLVANAVSSYSKAPVTHELPNDLVLGVYKVGGLLLHSFQIHGTQCLIIGVGINLNQKSFPDPISKFATSLYVYTKKSWDRKPFVDLLTTVLKSVH